jgi:hypothetical protein
MSRESLHDSQIMAVSGAMGSGIGQIGGGSKSKSVENYGGNGNPRYNNK